VSSALKAKTKFRTFFKLTLANEHGSFFDNYKDVMVLWSFAVVSFMFLFVSFLRSRGIKAVLELIKFFLSQNRDNMGWIKQLPFIPAKESYSVLFFTFRARLSSMIRTSGTTAAKMTPKFTKKPGAL